MQKLCPEEVDMSTYKFGVHKTIGVLYFMVIIIVRLKQRHGVRNFNYCFLEWDLSNRLLNNPNGNHMQNIHPWGVYVPTYHFWVKKTIDVSYTTIVFRVDHTRRLGVGPFYYFTPWWELSNVFSSDPNGDLMQKLCSPEVVVPTWNFGVHKIVGVSSTSVIYSIHDIWRHGVHPFHFFSLSQYLSSNLSNDRNGDCMQKLR